MESEIIIQRYMNLSKFLFLLQNSSLFLPKMSIFDDQLEGGLTANDYLKKSNDADILDLSLNGFLPVSNETSKEREERLKNANSLVQQLKKSTFDTPFGSYLKDDVQDIFPKCREHIYVSCWHRSSFECSAMWQLYGAERNSVCIFTTAGKLNQQLLDKSSTYKMQLEEVHYLDHAVASFDERAIHPFVSKSLSFSFEKELRLVAYNPCTDIASSGNNNLPGIKIGIRSLSELIDKIIVSPDSESWFKECIENLCRQYNLNVEVEKSSLSRERTESFWSAMEQLQKNGL
ncbi:TPA: hypothetical protein ACX6R5_000854 [Photobacterium damselae]